MECKPNPTQLSRQDKTRQETKNWNSRVEEKRLLVRWREEKESEERKQNFSGRTSDSNPNQILFFHSCSTADRFLYRDCGECMYIRAIGIVSLMFAVQPMPVSPALVAHIPPHSLTYPKIPPCHPQLPPFESERTPHRPENQLPPGPQIRFPRLRPGHRSRLRNNSQHSQALHSRSRRPLPNY